MTTLRLGDAPVRLSIPIGEALTIVAPAGSSAYVADFSDFDPAASVSGTTHTFGPYTKTETVTVKCTAGAVDFSIAKVDASQAVVSGGGNTATPSIYYHLAYRGAQAGNGPMIDQSGANHDAANNSYIFPTGWTAAQAVALGAYRAPTNPNAATFATGLPLFKCTTAGTTSGTEPAWNTTIGGTTPDGTAVWTAEKGAWYVDAGGVRQFRSLLDTQLGGTTAELGGYNLGVLPWDLLAGDSLIISVTSLQNYTSGPTNFSETAIAGNRTAGSAAAGISLIATGQTSFNDLRLRISDGTVTRNMAHLDSGGVATNRAGDGARHTTTCFVDGQTKRMYLCADGVPRTAANNYAGVNATDLVAWDADISGITGSTSAGTRPLIWGTQPNADGSINATSYEIGASRLDVLVFKGRGLPAALAPIADWFHNRGEGLLPQYLTN